MVKYTSRLVSASTKWKDSLRTTMPKELVDIFELKPGDGLEWEFDYTKGKAEAVVRKIEPR